MNITYDMLSPYQKQIFDEYTSHADRNMYISAYAGSAKSTTALFMINNSKNKCIYLAFNKSVEAEFKKKIEKGKADCNTIHALGFDIMRYNWDRENVEITLDGLKLYKIADELVEKMHWDRYSFEKILYLKNNFMDLYSKMRVTCAEFNDVGVRRTIETYGLFDDPDFTPPSIKECVRIVLFMFLRSNEIFNKYGRITQEEMLTITLDHLREKENMSERWKIPPYRYYSNIFCDEAQDLNNAQLNLITYIRRKGGRYVFILDSNQAIYGWNGANSYSYKHILEKFAPIDKFTLPINYRCPVSHIDLVRDKFDIDMIPRDGAPTGKIKEIKFCEIAKFSLPGDLVIARKNRDLVKCMSMLVSKDIPVAFEDPEMKKKVDNIINKLKDKNIDSLISKIKREERIITDKLNKKKMQGKKEIIEEGENGGNVINDDALALYDLIGALVLSYKKKNANGDLASLSKYISTILTAKEKKNVVRLMSIHKAKGLEADRVFVLNEGNPMFNSKMTPEQKKQEKNLSYVALTRAKDTLFLVKSL